MSEKSLGKVSLTPKGDWRDNMVYNVLDVVRHAGKTYLYTDTSAMGVAPVDGVKCMLIAAVGQDAFVRVDDVTAASAALYDESTLAYYPAGKNYFGVLHKWFVVKQINNTNKFLPLGITYVTAGDDGISVFDPVTENYILVRTWESMQGIDGKNIELDVNATHIVWRTVGSQSWNNLLEISALSGKDGNSVELQVAGGYIQWRQLGSETWQNLIAISSLVGTSAYQAALAGGLPSTVTEVQFNQNLADVPKKLNKTLPKDCVLVGNEVGEAQPEPMIQYIDPNLTNPTQIHPVGFAVRLNTGEGITYLHNIFRSIPISAQTAGVTQIYSASPGRSILVKDIYVMAITRNTGSYPSNIVAFSLSTNSNDTVPFSTVSFPPSAPVNYPVEMSLPDSIVSLENGMFFKTEGWTTPYTLQMNVVVIINALYL